jgi:ankyrin repeat protein
MDRRHLFVVYFLIIFSILIINYFYFKASTRGHIDVVKELLSRNADIEAKDKFDDTPLIRGIFLNYNMHLNCLLFIIYSF